MDFCRRMQIGVAALAVLASGALVPLLRDYSTPGFELMALYPHGRYMSAKVRAFIDLVKEPGPVVRRLVPDEYLGNRRSDGAQRLIGGGKFPISWQSGKNLWRSFGFGTQNDTRLAAPGECGERALVPVAHGGGLVPIEASELEWLTIEFF